MSITKIELAYPPETDNEYVKMLVQKAIENLGDKLDKTRIEKIIIVPDKVVNFILKSKESA